GTVRELADRYIREEPKGECVIAIYCGDKADESVSDETAEQMLRSLLDAGNSARDAAAQVSSETGIRKNTLYAKAMEIKNRQE
ncbi:MAG: 16S rRNA (cytidine(1402)-2'-O)-methyltransferase, partial [Clostridia bacterium]|nr:16S rRNA (cytidine(1402)-2'-O)-methyltransferase [Clostridia bacterium]